MDFIKHIYFLSFIQLLLFFENVLQVYSTITLSSKVCRGTSNGLGHGNQAALRYDEMVKMYTNCTLIDGNLELSFINIPHVDLSFLSTIREITGYLLIFDVWADYIPLTSLLIIRGREFFVSYDRNYSIFIAYNFEYSTNLNVGIMELQFRSLREIQAGNVFINENNRLCHVDHVNWSDILNLNNSLEYVPYDTNYTHRTCGSCHSSCESRYCWGDGPDMCQKLIKVICSAQCDGQCFGPSPNQCCHKNCAGGCTGPLKSHCLACRDFDNNGICVASCSDVPIQSQTSPSYNKYTYGTLCVDKCPEFMNKYNMACVKDCGAQRKIDNDVDRNCIPCDGPCPKNCRLPDNMRYINSGNIHLFQDCTIVQGNIVLLDTTFKNDEYLNLTALDLKKLKTLENVQEVMGYVTIQANIPTLRNLSFLRNLRVIHGQSLVSRVALQIFKTSLNSISLDSLRQIKNGHVFISNNSRLCYASSVNWSSMFTSTDQKAVVDHNRNQSSCVLDNEICNSECSNQGCMGPGEEQCISCMHYSLRGQCLASCNASNGYFVSARNVCEFCHSQCEGGCTNMNASSCTKCKKYKNEEDCVEVCPIYKYPNSNGVCQFCHNNCDISEGCTGPYGYAGPGGCRTCLLAIESTNNNNISCVESTSETCPIDHFRILSKPMCGKCHSQCKSCIGYGSDSCIECHNFKQENVCVEKCDSVGYTVVNDSVCLKCHELCLHCNGSTSFDCLVCKNKKVYSVPIEDWSSPPPNMPFSCSIACPEKTPESRLINNEVVCAPIDPVYQKTLRIIIILVILLILFLILVLSISFLYWSKKRKIKKFDLMISCKMDEESQDLVEKESKICPDKSVVKLIKISELDIGEIIGKGAYGTVRKGIWNPSMNESFKVAIKILNEFNKQLMDEAHIMFSVNHKNCISIKGMCLTNELYLVTELMQYGCLLEFVRYNNRMMEPKRVLEWCQQIAEGMDYLGTKHIVHCDLAARNVLVENVNLVKITDFGLARFVAVEDTTTGDRSQKMPIKWVALETLIKKEYTHKSDVWSFGVTMWEICTFGSRPYSSIQSLPKLITKLEKGERLKKPETCSEYLFAVMKNCWLEDPNDRYSFSTLIEKFDYMLKNPNEYFTNPLIMTIERNSLTENSQRSASISFAKKKKVPTATLR